MKIVNASELLCSLSNRLIMLIRSYQMHITLVCSQRNCVRMRVHLQLLNAETPSKPEGFVSLMVIARIVERVPHRP